MKKILLIVTSFLLVSNLMLSAADSYGAAVDRKKGSKKQQSKQTFYDILKLDKQMTGPVLREFGDMVVHAYVQAGLGIKTPDVAPEKRLQIINYLLENIGSFSGKFNNENYKAHLVSLKEQASSDLAIKLERLRIKAEQEESARQKIEEERQKHIQGAEERRRVREAAQAAKEAAEAAKEAAAQEAVREHKKAGKNQKAAQQKIERQQKEDAEKRREAEKIKKMQEEAYLRETSQVLTRFNRDAINMRASVLDQHKDHEGTRNVSSKLHVVGKAIKAELERVISGKVTDERQKTIIIKLAQELRRIQEELIEVGPDNSDKIRRALVKLIDHYHREYHESMDDEEYTDDDEEYTDDNEDYE